MDLRLLNFEKDTEEEFCSASFDSVLNNDDAGNYENPEPTIQKAELRLFAYLRMVNR